MTEEKETNIKNQNKEKVQRVASPTPLFYKEKNTTQPEVLFTELPTAENPQRETLFQEGKKYLKKIGPGLVTGAADDDPSGITTYSQAGAQYGTGMIWLSAWLYPLVSMVQEMCARIAMVTGRGLASNIKHNYSKKILGICTVLLFLANVFNIGADLGAMSKAVQLIIPTAPFMSLVVFIGISGLLLEIFVPYRIYTKYLRWLVVALFSYIITGLVIDLNWTSLLRDAVVPQFSFGKNQILLLTGILGTTISPYLFFWQTSEEIEEEILEGRKTIKARKGATREEIKKMKVDVWSGMFLSNLVMFFIIAVSSHTLFANGITNIETAADAAIALTPLAGSWATVLFAIGIVGTGLLAIPVLAGSTAYAISEYFGWKEGLHRKFRKAHAFYGVIIFSILVGILLNFVGINPMKALLYSAIANGVIAPVILVFIVKLSASKKIMGEFKNSTIKNIIGWIVVGAMSFAAVATIVSLF